MSDSSKTSLDEEIEEVLKALGVSQADIDGLASVAESSAAVNADDLLDSGLGDLGLDEDVGDADVDLDDLLDF